MESSELLIRIVSELVNSNTIINVVKGILKKRQKMRSLVLKSIFLEDRKVLKNRILCRTIALMDDEIFYFHFHMKRSTFKILFNMLRPMWTLTSTGRKRIRLENALYWTIWKLANRDTFRQTSSRFVAGMDPTSKAFFDILKLICRLKVTLIKFPTDLEGQKKIANGFSKCLDKPFPLVLGCIDVTNIPISKSKNRTGTFSIIAQAIVDSEMKFLDVFIGCAGRCDEAAMWKMSPIRKAIVSGEITIPPDHHFLAGGAYPLETFLMVPFGDNGQLTPQQSAFNTIHSSNRDFVKGAFGILKKKFPILKNIDVRLAHLPKTIVLACMVLHNLIITNEGQQHIDDDLVAFCPENAATSEGNNIAPASQCDEANQKRDGIAALLSV